MADKVKSSCLTGLWIVEEVFSGLSVRKNKKKKKSLENLDFLFWFTTK